MNNSSEVIKSFVDLFDRKPNDKIILWTSEFDDVGFTVVRNYPENLAFIPAINKEGEIDTVCMIKVGFLNRKGESDTTNLFGSVSKVSDFLLSGHFDYDFNDPKSPTKDSLEKSKKSQQPIDLELSDYLYNKNTREFFDLRQEKKKVSLTDIVEKLYTLHLKTVTLAGFWFRFKIRSKELATAPVEDIKKFLISILGKVFGKTLQSENKVSFDKGLTKVYGHNELYSLADESIDFFDTGIKIPKKSVYISAVLIFVIMISFVYWFSPPRWWIELKGQNQIVQLSFALVFVWIIDYGIPHLILSVINFLIRFRIKMWEWRIRIN